MALVTRESLLAQRGVLLASRDALRAQTHELSVVGREVARKLEAVEYQLDLFDNPPDAPRAA